MSTMVVFRGRCKCPGGKCPASVPVVVLNEPCTQDMRVDLTSLAGSLVHWPSSSIGSWLSGGGAVEHRRETWLCVVAERSVAEASRNLLIEASSSPDIIHHHQPSTPQRRRRFHGELSCSVKFVDVCRYCLLETRRCHCL